MTDLKSKVTAALSVVLLALGGVLGVAGPASAVVVDSGTLCAKTDHWTIRHGLPHYADYQGTTARYGAHKHKWDLYLFGKLHENDIYNNGYCSDRH